MWPVGVTALTLLYAMVPPFVGATSFYRRGDSASQFLPTWVHFGDLMRDGAWPPLMDPNSWHGGNYAAEALFGVYNPINALNWLVASFIPNLDVAATLVKAEFLALLALGIYLLAREYGAARWAASLVAVALPFSGFTLYWDAATWAAGLIAFAYVPYVWWAFRRAAHGRLSPIWAFVVGALAITQGSGTGRTRGPRRRGHGGAPCPPASTRRRGRCRHRWSGADRRRRSPRLTPEESVGAPGLVVLGELDDVAWQLVTGEHLDRDVLEDVAEVRPGGNPDELKDHRAVVVLHGLGSKPVHADQRTVNRPDDVGDADIAARSPEPPPTALAPHAHHDSGAPEVGEDGLQEAVRDVLEPPQLLCRHRHAINARSDLDQRPQGVVGLG